MIQAARTVARTIATISSARSAAPAGREADRPLTLPDAGSAMIRVMATRRFASVIRLRPEHEAEYRRLHAEPWEGVLASPRAANVTNYSIFLRDGLLFSYLEYAGEDHDADMARIAADEETRRWWRLTDPCQQPLESAAEGEWWAPAEEVFHLD